MPQSPDNPLWGITLERMSSQIAQPPVENGDLGREKAHAVSLHTLFFQMADPSLDLLVSITGGLMGTPADTIGRIRDDISTLRRNPRDFFGTQGITIEDPERLTAGIENFGEFLDRLPCNFDDQTYGYFVSENINPEIYAAGVHEKIQIRNGERSIRKKAQLIRDEPDLVRRMRLGQSLKEEIMRHVNESPYTFYREYGYDREDLLDPTWENITSGTGLLAQLDTQEIRSKEKFALEDAVVTAQAAMLRYPLDQRIEQIPKRDKERFDRLRFTYGAKAANLLILWELITAINNVRGNELLGVTLAVPEFQAIPVDIYRKWQTGELTDELLRPYFEWASELRDKKRGYTQEPADYIVRSSAVFSEDGENNTGAGIYESVQVYGGASFDVFRDAVIQVYESTNRPQAQAYRAEHGIPNEEMGLVIQRYVSNTSFRPQSKVGYINSRLVGVPQLMEVVTETSRNFIKRDDLDFFLGIDPDAHEDIFASVHHFPPDQDLIDPNLAVKVSLLAFVIERLWGKAIQAEFVAGAAGSAINFVQVRELPQNVVSQQQEITFPDQPPLHTGAAVGVGDVTLPLLDNRSNNSDRAGIVVFRENYRWSQNGKPQSFPQEGAIIIAGSEGTNGHLQTLCAERGLICVFPDAQTRERIATFPYDLLFELDRVRIVANGIEARVYSPLS